MNTTEDSEARNDAGFDNYLLDQSVVSNGAGHTTMWNSGGQQAGASESE